MSGWEPDGKPVLYKRAMIGARSIKPQKRKQNWVLAKELFVVGRTYAYLICEYAGVDPEGTNVTW